MAVRAPEIRSVFFEPGRRVRVRPLASERAYYCLIEDVPNGSLYLTMPMDGREYAPIAAGERVQLAVERRGNLYMFESIVTGRRFGAHPTLIIKRPPDQTATQRRAHVRVPVLLDATLWLPDEHSAGQGRPIKIILINISAGGLGFRSKERFEPGTLVTIELTIPSHTKRRNTLRHAAPTAVFSRRWSRRPEAHAAYIRHHQAESGAEDTPFVVAAEVVHCTATRDEPERDKHGRRIPRVYHGGVRFIDIGEVVQERIIRYVVRREIELRYRGLI